MTMHIISFEPEAAQARTLRDALGRFATGVTVITTRTPAGRLEGLTANSFSAVSLDPPLVLWSLRRGAASLASFRDAGCFAVNVLAAEQAGLSRRFAAPLADRFEGIAYENGTLGCPLLPGCLATFECRTESAIDGGDHVIFLGRVAHATFRSGEPLIFSAGSYGTHAPLAEA